MNNYALTIPVLVALSVSMTNLPPMENTPTLQKVAEIPHLNEPDVMDFVESAQEAGVEAVEIVEIAQAKAERAEREAKRKAEAKKKAEAEKKAKQLEIQRVAKVEALNAKEEAERRAKAAKENKARAEAREQARAVEARVAAKIEAEAAQERQRVEAQRAAEQQAAQRERRAREQAVAQNSRAAAARAQSSQTSNSTAVASSAGDAPMTRSSRAGVTEKHEDIKVELDHSKEGKGLSGVVGAAYSGIGIPYVWGGETRSGWDCSGMVKWAYAQAGINIPRGTSALLSSGRFVRTTTPQPGDLVFQNGGGHVGIYVGNGQMIGAQNPATGTTLHAVSRNPLYGYYTMRG